MTEQRYVFHFPELNVYEVVWAVSCFEARHRLMRTKLAPFYNQAVLLNP